MGNLDRKEFRHSPACRFCGFDRGLRCYPTDVSGFGWYACADCVALIHNESWDDLIERIIAAFAALQPMCEDDQVVFRRELADQLKRLNTFDDPLVSWSRMAMG
jgi:hypothetical protein